MSVQDRTVSTPIEPETLARLRNESETNPLSLLARNAVTETDIDKVSLNRERVLAINPEVETKLDQLGVTNQKSSGRCWMFAALNVHRHRIAKELNLKDFEFSESYLQFFDKLEKANYSLRAFSQRLSELDADTTDIQAFDDRVIDHVLRYNAGDGGFYHFFTNLVAKYGIVPKYAFDETESSSSTRKMSQAIESQLRKVAWQIVASDRQAEAVEKLIEQGLEGVYRILAAHLGQPPTSFVWQYRNKDDEFTRVGEMTPQQFTETYLPNLDDFVVLQHDPRPSMQQNQLYQLQYCNNVWGTQDYTYLNTSLEELRAAAKASLDQGTPVWFACDVDQQFSRQLGLWDPKMFQREEVYGIDLGLSRAERLLSRDSVPTHAMSLTGYDAVEAGDGTTSINWRVENSWGTKDSDGKTEFRGEGFGTMTDSWFDTFLFQVVVPRACVPEHLLPGLDTQPIQLPVYDLMA